MWLIACATVRETHFIRSQKVAKLTRSTYVSIKFIYKITLAQLCYPLLLRCIVRLLFFCNIYHRTWDFPVSLSSWNSCNENLFQSRFNLRLDFKVAYFFISPLVTCFNLFRKESWWMKRIFPFLENVISTPIRIPIRTTDG